MPCHWTETTYFLHFKFTLIRIFSLLQFLFGLKYLLFRFTNTIGLLSTNRIRTIYQYLFFLVELFSFITLTMRTLENWNITVRNSVDFRRILPESIVRRPSQVEDADEALAASQTPTVDILIPCYNEDVALVEETVSAALNVDYPAHRLNVYLCDDGNDILKESMVKDMKKYYDNLHYITREVHKHAKAGNLNSALRQTHGDFVTVLDADFIARPHMIQRMMSYFFVWNRNMEKYEIDDSLAAVQAPQHYRNVSPYDQDLTDQRATYFMEFILPAKDWNQSAPIIGTTNLMRRKILEEVGLFPVYSLTEDTALSINFHKNGYKTYYVNESLASGVAPTSLWASVDQRSRWLKGDWQIFFSKHGPILTSGLTLRQRILYMNMGLNRAQSILNILFDVSCFLLLVFGIEMVDVVDTWTFLARLIPYFMLCSLVRLSRTIGSSGLLKSDAGALAFEAFFRFVTLTGLIAVIFKGRKLKFVVTQKPSASAENEKSRLSTSDWWKNIQRAWFNVLMIVLLSVSLVFAFVGPRWTSLRYGNTNSTPLIMAIGFTVGNLMPHMLSVYLCFYPLLNNWMMKDRVHGRCDQYAVDPMSGKLFVPRSAITVFSILQSMTVLSSMIILAVLTPKIAPDIRSLPS